MVPPLSSRSKDMTVITRQNHLYLLLFILTIAGKDSKAGEQKKIAGERCFEI